MSGRTHATATGLLLLAAIAAAAPVARAEDEVEIHARVVVDSTVLRSGPGASFRRVWVAERGDVFPVRERATRGYWFRVELPDGTYGWIQGDTVYNHEVGEGDGGAFLPWLFAPPPLPEASGELAVTAGVLGGGGTMAARPAILLAPQFGFELTALASVATGGRLLVAAAGPIVNVFPKSPIVPFVVAGGGVAVSDPNADTFLLEAGTTHALYGGGGLRFGFRYRLTLRIDVRAWAFYEADRYVAREEISGGLTVFF